VNFLLDQTDLRQFQRKRRRPLLPLGTVFTDINVVDPHTEIVPVRPGVGLSETQITLSSGF
jgi:hypothetical protein